MPPAGPPRASRPRRRVVRKPKPSAQNAQAYVSQGRAVAKTANRQRQAARAQRQTQNAQPLAPRPQRPTPVAVPKPTVARPLQATPPRVTRASRPVDTAKQARGVAVAAYDQLSGQAKQAHVRAAAKRVAAGKDTQTDRAILHAHTTRVAGKKKVVAATKAFDAIAGAPQQIDKLKQAAQSIEDSPFTAPSTGTSRFLPPGSTYGPPDKDGHRPILDRTGKQTGIAAKYVRPNVGSVADMPGAGQVVAAVGPLATKGLQKTPLPKVIKNIPKDLAENVVTSPTSIAKFAVDAAQHPGKAGKALVKPYKELYHHPGKFATERPVTAALMLSPAVRAPGLAAGRALRLTGKQTLARPAATLEGTALRQTRRGSRAAGRRAVQAAQDRKNPTPTVTARQIDSRVDSAYTAAQKHGERVRNSILGRAAKDAKKAPKDERAGIMAAAHDEAGNAVASAKRRHYAQEFGATHHVENGNIVADPGAVQGRVHSLQDAHAIKDHLNAQGQTIPRGRGSVFEGGLGAKLYGKENVPVTYTVRDAGQGKYAVMPEQVAKRLNVHGKIGKSPAVPAVVLRQTRRMLTRAVLPTHPTWLTGQAAEGGLRAAVTQAGPTSWMIAHRLQARHPDIYKALAERAVPGGLVGHTAANEMATRTFAQEVPDSLVARKLTEYGQKPGVKQARGLHDALVNLVFNRINGQLLEGVPQKAMLGRALRQSPLMERNAFGFVNSAVDKAANSIKGRPEEFAAAAREVERMYGKYAGYSPRLRSLIMHWTPFVPWWINSARYLLQTLPRDHPFATALAADIGATEEDWRKQQGLSLRYRDQNSLPPWMLGGLPVQGGKNLLRVGHYTPGGSETDLAGGVSGLFLPQFAGFYGAVRYGKDWKGSDLKHSDGSLYNQGERTLYGTAQLIESLVPYTGQAAQVLKAPEILGGPAPTDTSSVADRAKKALRPVSSVPIHRQASTSGVTVKPIIVKPVKVRPVKVKPVQAGG